MLRHYRKSDFAAHQAIVGDEAGHAPIGRQRAERSRRRWRRIAASVGTWDLMGSAAGRWCARPTTSSSATVSLFNAWRDLEPQFGEEPEMGWIFATEVHGQGIAGEACRAVLDWADANFPPTPVWAIISPGNGPSFKLAERLGFARPQ